MAASKKIAGIILAAGSASRMGTTKQILPFGSTTLLGQVVRNAQKSALYDTIVVLGHNADQIRKTVDLSSTTIAMNPGYAGGAEHIPCQRP